jgi:hypothetical protein
MQSEFTKNSDFSDTEQGYTPFHFRRRLANFLDKHEGKFLSSTVVLQAIGYSSVFLGVYAASAQKLDATTATALTVCNFSSAAYNWLIRGYYGTNSESGLRRFIGFVKNGIEQIWDNPHDGIDNVKYEIKHRSEDFDGLFGKGVQKGIILYERVRRTRFIGGMIHATRLSIENDVRDLRSIYDTVSLYVPTEYSVTAPRFEYGADTYWIHESPAPLSDSRKHRILLRE